MHGMSGGENAPLGGTHCVFTFGVIRKPRGKLRGEGANRFPFCNIIALFRKNDQHEEGRGCQKYP